MGIKPELNGRDADENGVVAIFSIGEADLRAKLLAMVVPKIKRIQEWERTASTDGGGKAARIRTGKKGKS